MLFKTLFSILREQRGNDVVSTRRQSTRRIRDKCVSVINKKTYPVENWSTGGLMIYGDSRPFGIDNDINVTMKFKLYDRIIDVSHKARVIRKTHDNVAFEFLPLTRQIRSNFQNVVDDYVTNQFAESQAS